MRLIDGDALIEAGKNTSEFRQNLANEYDLECLVVGMPTITPDSLVKRGRWTRGDMPTYGGYKCSVCGGNTVHYKAKFCPSCGALMED